MLIVVPEDAPPEGKKKGAVKRRAHVAAAEVLI